MVIADVDVVGDKYVAALIVAAETRDVVGGTVVAVVTVVAVNFAHTSVAFVVSVALVSVFLVSGHVATVVVSVRHHSARTPPPNPSQFLLAELFVSLQDAAASTSLLWILKLDPCSVRNIPYCLKLAEYFLFRTLRDF